MLQKESQSQNAPVAPKGGGPASLKAFNRCDLTKGAKSLIYYQHFFGNVYLVFTFASRHLILLFLFFPVTFLPFFLYSQLLSGHGMSNHPVRSNNFFFISKEEEGKE